MSVDGEELLFLNRVPNLKWFPTGKSGRPVHVSTLVRWARKGVRGVRLETVRLGGRLCTSREAVRRFCNRLNSPSVGAPPPSGKTPRATEATLDALGY